MAAATHAGRVAVVTGAGRGIGAAIAAELAARGARVAALEAD
ncbi:SDR family NAD(P)-dependent oxidoreductase, partial [Roseomonas alkaliterrae]